MYRRGRGTGEQARRSFECRGVDNREQFRMPALPEGSGPIITLNDVWLFAATSVAIIFIMMITAGLIGLAIF